MNRINTNPFLKGFTDIEATDLGSNDPDSNDILSNQKR